MLDRISHAQKKIVNFAKKTIGMDVEETEEPQKCEYYYCIFREMNLVSKSNNTESSPISESHKRKLTKLIKKRPVGWDGDVLQFIFVLSKWQHKAELILN